MTSFFVICFIVMSIIVVDGGCWVSPAPVFIRVDFGIRFTVTIDINPLGHFGKIITTTSVGSHVVIGCLFHDGGDFMFMIIDYDCISM